MEATGKHCSSPRYSRLFLSVRGMAGLLLANVNMDAVSRECTAFAAPMHPLVRLRFVACQIGFKGISRPVGVIRVHPLLDSLSRASIKTPTCTTSYKTLEIDGLPPIRTIRSWASTEHSSIPAEKKGQVPIQESRGHSVFFSTPDTLYNIRFMSCCWDSYIDCIRRWFKSPSVVGPSMPRQKLPWPRLLNSSRSYGGRIAGSDGCTSGVVS